MPAKKKETKSFETELEKELNRLAGNREHVAKTVDSLDRVLSDMDYPADSNTTFSAINTKLTCLTLMLCSIDIRLELMARNRDTGGE